MEQDPAARIAALEAELTSARAELAAERERYERRLKLAQSALPERRDPRTVTQNIAAQQEIEALRGAMRERDRVVKELTQQVRDLEDRLEDQYRITDAIRQQLDQREEALDAARRQADAASRRAAPPPPPPPSRVQQPPPSRPPPQGRTGALAFVSGVLVGALLACAVAVGLWWTDHWPAAPELTARAMSDRVVPAGRWNALQADAGPSASPHVR